jgi:hypothetical protein
VSKLTSGIINKVPLPRHKQRGFPPGEENACGVLKKRPCYSSRNLKVGDFSLGFTLKKKRRLIYTIIIILTFVATFYIVFILGPTSENYEISYNIIEKDQVEINENNSIVSFILKIRILPKKTLTKTTIEFDFSDNINYTPLFENKYNGEDVDTLWVNTPSTFKFDCNTTNTTLWFCDILISFGNEYDQRQMDHVLIHGEGSEIPSLSFITLLMAVLFITTIRKILINRKKEKDEGYD